MSVLQPEHQNAVFYVQIEPIWSDYRYNGELALRGAKVGRVTQKRPTSTANGAVVVKLTLSIPASAFMPLRPEAVVVVPEQMTDTITRVTVNDANSELKEE